MITPPDQAARTAGATDLDSNLVVVAGAGTGKTSLLVERILNLILGKTRRSVSRLLVITFTKKAAGELRVRIAEGLGAVLASLEPAPPALKTGSEAARSLAWLRESGCDEADLAQRARKALEDLDGASVGTIHGFASDLLRRHPLAAGLPPDYQPDEGESRRLLFQELWPDFLSTELAEASPTAEAWLRVLSEFSQKEIEELARSLVESPISMDFLERQGYDSLDPQVHFGETVERLRGALEQALPQVKETEKLHEMIRTELRLLAAFLDRGVAGVVRFPDAAVEPDTFWSRSDAFKPRSIKNAVLKEQLREPATEAIQLLNLLRKLEYRDVAGLMEVLRGFAARFRMESARIGAPAFDDLLLRARNLLRDYPEVRRAESARYDAMLLDEFQDTDPLQYEIMFHLAADPDAGASATGEPPLSHGKLFIVGDPKQSIYRFRGADMVSYRNAVTRVLSGGGKELRLTANFRSVPEVLAPLNRLFDAWFPEGDVGVQPEYERIAATRPAAEEPRVELWSVPSPGDAAAHDRREAEARVLAASVRRWTSGGEYALKDIAILCRALTQISTYTRALREAGIDYIVDGGKAFSSRPEVVEALALLRAIGNPADPVGVLGVLRSTLGAVPDAELARFATAGKAFTWRQPVDDDMTERFPGVARTFLRLKDLDRSTRRLPADRRILALLTEGDLPVLMASYFEGAQRVANVRKLAYRAAELARERLLTLDETVQALEMEFVGQYNEGESPLADEAVDAVRILSVHAAKGLQFRVVVLADLRKDRQDHRPLPKARVHWMEDRLRLAVRTGKRKDLAMQLAEEEDARHSRAESKRLLYVAATRAEDRLVILNSHVRAFPEWVQAMDETWGYAVDAHLHPPFPHEEQLAEGEVAHWIAEVPTSRTEPDLPEPLPVIAAVNLMGETTAAIPRPESFPFRSPSSDHHATRTNQAVNRTEDVAPPPPELARTAGTAVHRVLQQWDFRDPNTARELLADAAASLTDEAFPADRILETAAGILDAFLATDLPARLGDAEILGREVPILFRDVDGMTVHGYVDLVYRHEGRVHVADYKTDRTTDPAAKAADYRDQLTDYGVALTRALSLDTPPVLEILLLRTGDRVEVTPAENAAGV